MTPDEKRQQLIVRQNVLSHATKLLCQQLVLDKELQKVDDGVLVSKIFITATKMENWVFSHKDVPTDSEPAEFKMV